MFVVDSFLLCFVYFLFLLCFFFFAFFFQGEAVPPNYCRRGVGVAPKAGLGVGGWGGGAMVAVEEGRLPPIVRKNHFDGDSTVVGTGHESVKCYVFTRL